jgi:hypothetical protein
VVDDFLIIEEVDVPLGLITLDDFITIEETPVPLANMPQTGLVSLATAMTVGFASSVMAAAVAIKSIRKIKAEQE